MSNTISGLCRIWCRRTDTDPYWQAMTYAARDYHGCVRIKQAYERRFGDEFTYVITADHDLCRPATATLAG